MILHSIGARLTLWYASLFAVGLAALGIAMWFALRGSLYHAVDEGLRDRLVGIARFIEDHESRLDLDEVKEEFRAHGELFQVADQRGSWVHRGADLAGVDAPSATDAPSEGTLQTAWLHGQPYRVLSQPIAVGGQRFTVQVAAPLDDLEQGLYDSLWFLLPAFPLALSLATIGGYWMSRRALAPVDDIARVAKSITADDLGRRLTVPASRDELARLAETFNEMIGRLESSFRGITRFTADAAHELRTPLAVMRTTAEVALREGAGSTNEREALEHVVAELERTTQLVENLLLIAKADSGAAQLRREQIDLVAAVDEACAQARLLARVKGVALATELPERSIWVTGDGHALRRLFLILLDNAVKYTPAGGRCEVRLVENGTEVIATVADTGIGISASDLPHVFERFYRVDRARSREQGGAGLGLAIGRWIAEAHGGGIFAESALDGGSSFRVHLPRA
jgi:heavy metal sensor kinase